jgi:hypothetical protein
MGSSGTRTSSVLAVPTHRFRELPRDLFAGKILIDAMNYWEPIDGVDARLGHRRDHVLCQLKGRDHGDVEIDSIRPHSVVATAARVDPGVADQDAGGGPRPVERDEHLLAPRIRCSGPKSHRARRVARRFPSAVQHGCRTATTRRRWH